MKLPTITLAFIVLTATAAFANPSVRTIQRHTIATAQQGAANIEPVAKADADVAITDDGINTLTVMGSGTGFVPGLSHVSFFYGIPSKARGPAACLPPTPNLFTPQQMLVGYWMPLSGINRTLVARKTGIYYVPLTQIGTMSIRYDSTPQIDPTIGQTPLRFYLQSCSAVR